ncbi:hypothetical protein BGX20_004217, partial [Mortierella sp. AD010]
DDEKDGDILETEGEMCGILDENDTLAVEEADALKDAIKQSHVDGKKVEEEDDEGEYQYEDDNEGENEEQDADEIVGETP